MKLKNKLILGATSLLVLSGVAAGTGAYAWYSATRLNTVSFENKTYSSSTGIGITLVNNTNYGTGTEYESYTDAAITGPGLNQDGSTVEKALVYTAAKATKSITDTSFAGIGTAHKPSIMSSDSTKAAAWFTDDYANAQVFTLTYDIVATGESKVGLYLSPKSTAVASNNTDDAAVRFSIINTPLTSYTAAVGDTKPTFVAGSPALKAYCAPNSTLNYSKYVYLTGDDTIGNDGVLLDDAAGDDAFLGKTQVDANGSTTSTKICDNSNFFNKGSDYGRGALNAEHNLTSDGNTCVAYIADLNPKGTEVQKHAIVTIKVWVEGTVTTGNPAEYTIDSAFNFYVIEL